MHDDNIEFIDNFLKSKKFGNHVLYAIIPNDDTGQFNNVSYDIIIETRYIPNMRINKKDVVKIETLFCDFRRVCKENDVQIYVKFFLQRRNETKNETSVYKKMSTQKEKAYH